MKQTQIELGKGLPANLDAERFVLGSVVLDSALYVQVAAALSPGDFSLEKHRRIFLRMGELHSRGEKIDRVTLANELMTHGQLESCDGLGYLVSLDDGLPQLYNLDSYLRIVKEKSRLRRILYTGQILIDRAIEQSPSEHILNDAAKSLLELNREEKTPLQTPAEIIEAAGGLDALLSAKVKGLATGFIGYDDKTSGLLPGELTILAARPSMGKTALALNMAAHVALKGQKPVAVFSLEMSRESLLTRLLCSCGRVNSYRYMHGYLNQEERNRLHIAAHDLSDAPLYIDDSAALTVMDIHSRTRRLKLEKGCGLCIIDYLGLLVSEGRTDNRNLELGAMTRGLKLMAKDLNIPVVALCQLSRAPETRGGDHRPILSDLRESGNIEQDADVVAFIFREEVYKPDRDDLKGQAELIIRKQRNGPTGTVRLVWMSGFTRFENQLKDLGQGEDE